MSNQPDPDNFRTPPSGIISISPAEIHVWRINFENINYDLTGHSKIISPEEKYRADKFHFEKDKTRFIIRHCILRCVLGRYLSKEPASIQYEYNSFGKPSLLSNTGIQFNLSQSNNLVLIAITCNREVGIDIEYMREDLKFYEIAKHFFSPYECSVLQLLPTDQERCAFYNCWTRKEAYIKAIGKGLAIPLDSFDVSLSPEEPPALLRARNDHWPETSSCSMCEIRSACDYSAAMVVEGSASDIIYWQWLK